MPYRTHHVPLRAAIHQELHGKAHSKRSSRKKLTELFAPPDDTNG